MASHARSRGREDESRLSLRTLVIAFISSLTAAVVTSHFWSAGTPVAAALTPVIVALVSELLHRPTEVIATRLTTTERPAILPEAGGAAPPPRRAQPVPSRVPEEPGSGRGRGPEDRRPLEPDGGGGPARIYRPRSRGGRRRRIAVGAVVVTGLLAFAAAAAALTVPELIAGQSIGKSSRKTTLFGGRHNTSTPEQQETTPTQTQTQTTGQTTPQQNEQKQKQKPKTTPQQQPGQQPTTPQQTTPSTPPGGQPPP